MLFSFHKAKTKSNMLCYNCQQTIKSSSINISEDIMKVFSYVSDGMVLRAKYKPQVPTLLTTLGKNVGNPLDLLET